MDSSVIVVVKEGDTLFAGGIRCNFFMAPMVHWPEVMVHMIPPIKILLSADAFGTFRALSGTIFGDEMDFYEAKMHGRRAGIMQMLWEYGTQVLGAFKKAAGLVCEHDLPAARPGQGSGTDGFVDLDDRWSSIFRGGTCCFDFICFHLWRHEKTPRRFSRKIGGSAVSS